MDMICVDRQDVASFEDEFSGGARRETRSLPLARHTPGMMIVPLIRLS